MSRVAKVAAILVVSLAAALGVVRFGIYPPIPGQSEIARGGGRPLGEERGTNSIAAAMISGAAGFRVIHFDLLKTSDGRFVCGSDWASLGGEVLDFKAFLAARDKLRRPPCVVEELIAWFQVHSNKVLYVDAREDQVAAGAMIAARLRDRVIVAASTPDAACGLRKAQVQRAFYAVDRQPLSYERLSEDLHDPCLSGVEAVVVSAEQAAVGKAFLARAVSGLPIYVSTVDNCMSAAALRLLGADGLLSEARKPAKC